MSVIDGDNNVGCWVEVRPLITSKLEPASFVYVLDTLYNLGSPFRFLIAAAKDVEVVSERRLVRFFLQFKDEQIRKQMSNVIRALLDVEVVGVDLPKPSSPYRFCADLELAKHCAFPIVNYQHGLLVNLVDRLVASVSGFDVCVEIVAKADPTVVGDIQRFVYKKTASKSGAGTAFLDPMVDLLGEVVGKNSNEPSKGRSSQRTDFSLREIIRNTEVKSCSNLFTCNVLVFGNTLDGVRAVKNALPATAMNHFKPFKTTKKQSLTPKLKTSSRHRLRNNILCNHGGQYRLFFS